ASSTRQCLDALQTAFLTGQGEPRQPGPIASKGVAEHFPGFADEIPRFAGALVAVRDRIALLEMAEATHAALTLASRLIDGYEGLKRARGYLDFADLIARTARLLTQPEAGSWVHFKLDQGLDHIL